MKIKVYVHISVCLSLEVTDAKDLTNRVNKDLHFVDIKEPVFKCKVLDEFAHLCEEVLDHFDRMEPWNKRVLSQILRNKNKTDEILNQVLTDVDCFLRNAVLIL